MELKKFDMSPRTGELEVHRRIELIRERLDSAARAADQLADQPKPAAQSYPVTARSIQALIKQRRKRDQVFGADLFADPAWDILLELYASELAQRRVPTGHLCDAAAVPATTALRWISLLEMKGMVCRRQDPLDGRRYFVSLSPDIRQRMEDYFRAIPQGVSLI
jgi:DNA-binding MarR family transcriptional regulator